MEAEIVKIFAIPNDGKFDLNRKTELVLELCPAINEFKDNIGKKLNKQNVKRIFTKAGAEIEDPEEVMNGDLIVVSSGEDFIPEKIIIELINQQSSSSKFSIKIGLFGSQEKDASFFEVQNSWNLAVLLHNISMTLNANVSTILTPDGAEIEEIEEIFPGDFLWIIVQDEPTEKRSKEIVSATIASNPYIHVVGNNQLEIVGENVNLEELDWYKNSLREYDDNSSLKQIQELEDEEFARLLAMQMEENHNYDDMLSANKDNFISNINLEGEFNVRKKASSTKYVPSVEIRNPALDEFLTKMKIREEDPNWRGTAPVKEDVSDPLSQFFLYMRMA